MSRLKLTTDRVGGIILALIGATVLVMSSQITARIALEEPGPSLFPTIAGLGLLVCGIGILAKKSTGNEKPFATKRGIIRMLTLFVALVLYVVVGLGVLGYLISTPIFLFVAYCLLVEEGKRVKWWVNAAFAVGIGVSLYLFFTYAVEIILPRGIIF